MRLYFNALSPASSWKATPVSALPPWQDAKRVCVDIETHDPTLKELGPGARRNGFITGIAFAIEDGPSHYLPIAHASGNLDRGTVLQYLRDQAASYRGQIVGANLSYDLDFLGVAGVHFNRASFRDVLVNAPLINELHTRYSLDAVATRLGLVGKDTVDLDNEARAMGFKESIKVMSQLPAHAVARYALHDVHLPLRILTIQEKRIQEQRLERICGLESRLIPVLAGMRLRGVRIDQDKLAQIEAWAKAEEMKHLLFIQKETGVNIVQHELWQLDDTAKALLAAGIHVPTTETGRWHIDKDFLAQCRHPVADALAAARKANKLHTTFVKSVRDHMTNGRIHCNFNQLAKDVDGAVKGARWGRMSTDHPNLQQQPSRDDFPIPWRSIYLPDEGGLWASCDYSQQEPRLVTHFASRKWCAGARQAVKAYRDNPLNDHHQMMSDMTGVTRTQAKSIYLGLSYGMGGARLAASLGLPVGQKNGRDVEGPEAAAILKQFNRMAPFVKELFDICRADAAKQGYITTILGRRCRFPKLSGGGYDWTQNAMNRLIQGSAADQTKLAMVLAGEAGYKLQLQVHDELALTVDRKEEAQELARIMQDAVELAVPSRVDVEIGPSWGEAE